MDIQTIHLISQYLAAAGTSYLEKTSNNSHFHLSWSPKDCKLLSPLLNENGYHLAFDYDSFILGWINKNHSCFGSIDMEGKSHAKIIDWIRLKSKNFGINKTYNYDFHYKTPYPPMTDDYIFPIANFELLEELASTQSFAQEAIEAAAENLGHSSETHICPQIFDTKAHLFLDEKRNLKIDIGFSILKTDNNDSCFYVKAWKDNKILNSAYDAILVNNNITAEDVVSFVEKQFNYISENNLI